MTGPLRNFSVIQKWFTYPSFLIVMQADLQADVFFWMSGFIIAFKMLQKIKENDGEMPQHPFKFMLTRYLRFLPLYLFMIMFLWKFIALLGGDGPRFYQFEEGHGC